MPTSFKCFSIPVKGTFQLSFAVLVCYRSQVVFRVRWWWHPTSRARPDARYSWNPAIIPKDFAYGAITLYGIPFQKTSASLSACALARHHISLMLPLGIQFALLPFRSTLIRESRLLSFPAGTKMLQFPAFSILSDQFGNPGFKICMLLAQAYRSLPRPS